MKRIAFFVVLIVSSSGCLLSQDTLVGKVIDSQSKESLAYVNIGVIGKNIGTVSSVNGDFKIIIPTGHDTDTIRVSSIGYEPMSIKVSTFRKTLKLSNRIKLIPKVVSLKEFVVSSRELKEKVLGNTTTSTSVTGGFSSNELGNEIGVKIKIKKSPTYVKDFNINIVENIYDTLKFRINFYDIKNGLPNKRLFDKNVIVVTTLKEGKLTVDLSDYAIVVEDDFIVAIEWIEDLGKTDGLRFSCGFLGKSIIARQTSQGKWTKITGVSVGINVRVKY